MLTDRQVQDPDGHPAFPGEPTSHGQARHHPSTIRSFTAGARSFSVRKRASQARPEEPESVPASSAPAEVPAPPEPEPCSPSGPPHEAEYKDAIEQLKHRVTAVEVLTSQIPSLSRVMRSGLQDCVVQEVQRQLAEVPSPQVTTNASSMQLVRAHPHPWSPAIIAHIDMHSQLGEH